MLSCFLGGKNRSGKLRTCSHNDCRVSKFGKTRTSCRSFPVMRNTDHCRNESFIGELINNNDAIILPRGKDDPLRLKPGSHVASHKTGQMETQSQMTLNQTNILWLVGVLFSTIHTDKDVLYMRTQRVSQQPSTCWKAYGSLVQS